MKRQSHYFYPHFCTAFKLFRAPSSASFQKQGAEQDRPLISPALLHIWVLREPCGVEPYKQN